MNRGLERLVSLLYPHKCFCCGALVPDSDYLCEDCAGRLPVVRDACPVCGKPGDACICGQLEGWLTRAAAPLCYREGVRHGIHRFKYDGRFYYAQFLARMMADCVRQQFAGEAFDAVTYVPMHRRKRWQRGYCPAELLARPLAKQLGLPVYGRLLSHTGKGRTQMKLRHVGERRENAARSFAVQPGARRLEGKRLLLVDDVFTTGSTAECCARLLRGLGAEAVFVVTAATVLH